MPTEQITCKCCGGPLVECDECHGSGYMEVDGPRDEETGQIGYTENCSECGGNGYYVKHFPPSVPVVQPEKLEHVHILAKQALVTGDPQELPESADDNDPRQHNCDAMGCPTLDHILYRLPFTDHREPIDIKAFAKTLAECIDFTAGPVQARELFEKKLKALIAEAKNAHSNHT